MRSTINATSNRGWLKSTRRGMQLLELIISLSIASILIAGMTSAVVISQRTQDAVILRASGAASAQSGIQQLQNDLGEAQQIVTRSANSMHLKLLDRNSDGVAESVHYRWNATSGPLESSSDGTTWRSLTPNLTNMQLNWRTGQPQSIASITPLETSGRVSYRGVASNTQPNPARTLSVLAPPGYVEGDVCVAILALSDNAGNVNMDGDWTKVEQGSQSGILAISAWYSTDVPAVSVFKWNRNAQAVGCIVHLSGNSTAQAYVNSSSSSSGGQVDAPSINGTHTNEFVVRALAGLGPAVYNGSPAVANHSGVLFRQVDVSSSSNDLTLAVATQSLPGGSIGPASFQFTPSSVSSCAITVAIRP